MGENKNRKSKRAFNIEKHSERHFDLEKEDDFVAEPSKGSAVSPVSSSDGEKHAKADNVSITDSSNTADVENVNGNGKSGGNNGSKKMLVLIALVVAALIFFSYKSCGNDGSTSEEPVPTDTTSNVQEDTTAQQPITKVNGDDTHSETTESPSTNHVIEGSTPTSNEVTPSNQSESVNTSSSETTTSQSNGVSVKEKAMQVWDGVYGDGVERKHKLGSDYKAVQRYVNKMYRNGYRH